MLVFCGHGQVHVTINAERIIKRDTAAVLRSVRLHCLNPYGLAQSIEDPIAGLDVLCVLPLVCGEHAACCADCHRITYVSLYGSTDTRFDRVASLWQSDGISNTISRHFFLNPIKGLQALAGVATIFCHIHAISVYSCLIFLERIYENTLSTPANPLEPATRAASS